MNMRMATVQIEKNHYSSVQSYKFLRTKLSKLSLEPYIMIVLKGRKHHLGLFGWGRNQ